jgi:tRNA-binding protein
MGWVTCFRLHWLGNALRPVHVMKTLVTIDDFEKLDVRVGRILEAAPLEKARKAAYRMKVDFGPGIGIRHSSAQITDLYRPEELIGRHVLGVVNFPPRNVAGFVSEVLVLGTFKPDGSGPISIVSPDPHPSVSLGDVLG